MSPSKIVQKRENDDSIRFKLPVQVKANFFSTCYERGQTPSTVLRNLIDAYIAGRLSGLPTGLNTAPPTPPRKAKA